MIWHIRFLYFSLSFFLSHYPSLYVSQSASWIAHLRTSQSASQSASLPTWLHIRLSTYLSVCQPSCHVTWFLVCPPFSLPVGQHFCLQVYPSICLSFCQFPCLTVWPENTNWSGRLCNVDLHVLTSLEHMYLILKNALLSSLNKLH